jgi:hypothetical protein
VPLTREQIQGVFRSFPEAKHDEGRKFNDEPPPVAGPEDFGFDAQANDDEQSGAGPKSSVAPPIKWLDMSNWDNEPRPEREWAIPDRVPLRQAGLFSGGGGAGKSILEIMKDVAHVTGKDWLHSLPVPGPAIYLGAEDDEKEIHIRFYDIAAHYGVTFRELIDGGLYVSLPARPGRNAVRRGQERPCRNNWPLSPDLPSRRRPQAQEHLR